MAVTTEPKNLRDVLIYERDDRLSREQATVATPSVLELGQVVGKNYKSITNLSQDTGTGISQSDVSLGPNAKKGDYVIHGTGVDVGYIMDPDGYRVDDFSAIPGGGEHISIDSGSVADGDQYTVTVGDGTGKIVPLNTTAVNGSHEAYGVSFDAYDASGGDMAGVVIVRDAVALAENLVWPDGISAGNKEVALAELADKGIITKEQY